jgi:hypothetical protein
VNVVILCRDYRESVIPIGLKGTCYFDELLRATSDWDFYMAGSTGFALITSVWENNYYGDHTYFYNPGALFLDVHLGVEYHISHRLGLFLDLSDGVSTVDLSLK